MKKISEFMFFAVISAIVAFSITMWQTLLPLYLDEKGFEAWKIGLSVSLIMNLSYFLSFLAGYVVDIIDWKKSLIIALLLLIIGTFYLIIIKDFWHFLIFAILIGTVNALITQSSVKVLVRSKSKGRGLMYSSYMFLSNLSRIMASYASGFIATLSGYFTLFIVSIVSLFPALGFVSTFKEKTESNHIKEDLSLKDVLILYKRDRRLQILVTTLFLHDLSIFIAVPYLALYAKYVIGTDEIGVGILSGTSNTTQLIFQLGAGWLADKIGGSLTLALHFIFVSLSYIVYSNIKGFIEALALYAFMGLAITLDLPARRLLITKYAPEEYVSAINGFADTIVGIGTILASLIGGYLWNVSPHLPILIGGLANFSTLPLILFLKYRKRRDKQIKQVYQIRKIK
ncbi:MAG: MFS transporter [Thermoproteales archaeon]|nr:MFS transporter [Thermoproteales archaeon]